jgi:hypothetical protein
MDVQAGNMRDENSDTYLSLVEARYAEVVSVLRTYMAP